MATRLLPVPLINLAPAPTTSDPNIPVRLFADAFIPWQWVMFPNAPVGLMPGPLAPPAMLAQAALKFFVHGDGRLSATSSAGVGTHFRTRCVVEVNVRESSTDFFRLSAGNQPSMSQLRFILTGAVVVEEIARGPVSSVVSVTRLDPNSIHVEMNVSGSVPWNVAGPQPAIDFRYVTDLSFKPASSQVEWTTTASHDGFPGHEFFLESGGLVRFNKFTFPTFFNPLSTGTATPDIPQAVEGALALGGVVHHRDWRAGGSFTP